MSRSRKCKSSMTTISCGRESSIPSVARSLRERICLHTEQAGYYMIMQTPSDIDALLRLVDREVWIVTAAAGGKRGGLTATWVAQASIDRERPVILAGLAPNHFTTELVEGTYKERTRLDEMISAAASHWRIGRLPKVELNLLRMGVYELLSYPQISANVTINEAIEIARLYCGDEAPMFINGVLDQVAATVGKKAQADESKQ
mgnify:CR=1 FL=1